VIFVGQGMWLPDDPPIGAVRARAKVEGGIGLVAGFLVSWMRVGSSKNRVKGGEVWEVHVTY